MKSPRTPIAYVISPKALSKRIQRSLSARPPTKEVWNGEVRWATAIYSRK